jgi:hypothetical protein
MIGIATKFAALDVLRSRLSAAADPALTALGQFITAHPGYAKLRRFSASRTRRQCDDVSRRRTWLKEDSEMRISGKIAGSSLRHLFPLIRVVLFMLAGVTGAEAQNVSNHRQDRSAVSRDQSQLSCLIERPFQIQRFAVSCPDATRVIARIADCCIPGDRWRLTGAVVDLFPRIEQSIASGEIDDFNSSSLVLSDMGGPGALEAIYECSYSGGVNVFPAESTILLQPDNGACQTTILEVDERIWRAP